ncbi:uncharacterized protein (DUF58 family) [Kibdelosporangium banguiense]|uniref:Uncharacterized protein (DUF58 family) n=1 Tax=Kibdelosporangium banguiense TaxID=1365924 RepID=A0ABS4TZS6_9PSEU|nr:DUF58 domain-containing protein [Kibdelosporangium banguiense]MBP2329907.1 uncharacterized protein (DUF58 family) [Kibdelosporangium banguiense]
MPTKSGVAVAVAAVVLLALGWLADYPELIALGFAGLAALLMAAAWMTLRPDLSAVREVRPQRVSEGEKAMGVITLTNESKRRSPPILATEQMANRQVQVPIPSLAGHGEHTTTYYLPTNRRGIFQVGPMSIGHTDPLRLMRVGQVFSAFSTLYVHPRLLNVEPVPTGQTRDMDGPTSSYAPQGGVAFHSLREYVPGDDWRLIHWKSTARIGQMMVRHNVVPNQPRLMVVLDTNSLGYSEESFEAAVSAAASLSIAAIRGGFPLELRTTGGAVAASDRAYDGAVPALDLLAAAQATRDDPGLAALPGMVSIDDSVALGVVTGTPDPRILSVLPTVRRHFLMLSLIQFSSQYNAPPTPLNGVVSLTVRSAEEFADAWNKLVRT